MTTDITLPSESSFLEFVKDTISRASKMVSENILGLKQKAKDSGLGASPQATRSILATLSNRTLPDPSSPYFFRIDLIDGEIYYFGHIGIGHHSDPPQSHEKLCERLIINRNASIGAWTVEAISKNPQIKARTRISIINGNISKIYPSETQQTTEIEIQNIINDVTKDSHNQPRTDSLNLISSSMAKEQFDLVQKPINHAIAIQGSPGSGKTALLLERLSKILNENSGPKQLKIALIGPSPQFLDYVRSTLEKIGGSSIPLFTPESMATELPTEIIADPISIKRLKGDLRMINLVDNFIRRQVGPLSEVKEIEFLGFKTSITQHESWRLLKNHLYESEGRAYFTSRETFSKKLMDFLVEKYQTFLAGRRMEGDPYNALEKSNVFQGILNSVFPRGNAVSLLKVLKTDAKVFVEYGKDLFSEEEMDTWLRYSSESGEKLSMSDLPILDYINHRLRGTDNLYDYIAIDEAQDLNPMQLCMISRHLPEKNMLTLTGDLAQATGLFSYESWKEIFSIFDEKLILDTFELTVSYRVPGDIIRYANKFLTLTKSNVLPAKSFLEINNSLEILSDRSIDFMHNLIKSLSFTAESEKRTTLVLGAKDSPTLKPLKQALSVNSLTKFMSISEIKGMEFDYVVIVNPNEIATHLKINTSELARIFYVATTRATQKLLLVSEGDADITRKLSLSGMVN
jgi:DNA helicase IV